MFKSVKRFLHNAGYGIEVRQVESVSNLRLTNIRRFESEGKLARICRKLERLFR